MVNVANGEFDGRNRRLFNTATREWLRKAGMLRCGVPVRVQRTEQRFARGGFAPLRRGADIAARCLCLGRYLIRSWMRLFNSAAVVLGRPLALRRLRLKSQMPMAMASAARNSSPSGLMLCWVED